MPAKSTRKRNHTKRSLPKKQGFFHLKIVRLLIILLIAATIPLTVMAVQRMQTIQQEAAEAQACDGGKLLNANPRPVTRGEEIVFSHTDGPITKAMFEQEDFTGNGADQKTCTWDEDNGWIRCKALGNDKSSLRDEEGNTISNHTWTFRDIKCNYVVVIPKSQDTGKPKNTPTPSTPGNPKSPTSTPTNNPTNIPTVTPTKNPTQPVKLGPPEIVKASCEGSTTDPKIKVYGYTAPLATSYIIRLRTSAGGNVVKEESTPNTELTISGIEKDKAYYYSVIAVDKDGKKATESKISSDRRITCSFPVQGAPSAMDIISDIWKELTQ